MYRPLVIVTVCFAVFSAVAAIRCYSGENGNYTPKECPAMSGACYLIYNTDKPEKGCDAIGCPGAVAKTKTRGGQYQCCDTDVCNSATFEGGPRVALLLVGAIATGVFGRSIFA
jgi:hypothetical protein